VSNEQGLVVSLSVTYQGQRHYNAKEEEDADEEEAGHEPAHASGAAALLESMPSGPVEDGRKLARATHCIPKVALFVYAPGFDVVGAGKGIHKETSHEVRIYI